MVKCSCGREGVWRRALRPMPATADDVLAGAEWIAQLRPLDFVSASEDRFATLAKLAKGLFDCGAPAALSGCMPYCGVCPAARPMRAPIRT